MHHQDRSSERKGQANYRVPEIYLSSSASSSHYSTVAAASSFASSCTSNSLLDSTKEGSTFLRRLFDMGMATHMEDYSGSPKMEPIENVNCSRSPRGLASEGSFEESAYQNRKQKIGMLSRTKTLTRWRCRGFRFRLKLRHIRIMLCGRIFKTKMI